MRWCSGFAILFYLSLLCTPQAFAVHDARVTPLADSQLQAVPVALQQYLVSQTDDNKDKYSAALIAPALTLMSGKDSPAVALLSPLAGNWLINSWQARAPPLLLRLIKKHFH